MVGPVAQVSAVPPAETDPPVPDAGAPDRLQRWLPWIVLLPVVASAVSAVVQGWVVVSDGAVIMVRAGDVLRGNVSTVGMPTSIAEFTGGPTPYHAGPLLFWVLAPFALLFGPTAGAIVGVSAIHGAALSGSVLVARRARNRTITVGAAISALVVAFSVFGSGHYYDPFNTLLPATCLLLAYLCSWRLLCGDARVLPVALVVGSFCSQVHVSYAVPVAVPLLVAVVSLVGPSTFRSNRPRPSMALLGTSAAVLVLCWIGPLIDALAHGGGNLLLLSHGASGGVGTLGIVGAWWTVANLTQFPPLQILDISDGAFRRGLTPVGVVVGGVLGFLTVRAAQRTSPVGRALLVAAGAALAGGMASAALLPDATIEGPQVTWFKVLGPFCVLALVGAWSESREPSARRPTWKAPAGVALVVLLAAIPGPIRSSTNPDSWFYDAVAPISREVRSDLDPDARYRIRNRGAIRVELFTEALLADLDGRGWDVGVTHDRVTYYGAHRVRRAAPGTTDLVVQDANLPAPSSRARRVATLRPDVDPAERRQVEEALAAWAADHGPIVLTPEARNHLVANLEGRPGLSRARVEAMRDDPDLLLTAPPGVIAEIYRNDGIESPALSTDLRNDLARVLGPTAIDVWAMPSEDAGG